MAEIEFSLLTVPTPEPYDKKDERRQEENFYYVLNQLFVLAKNAGFVLSDEVTNPTPPGGDIDINLDGVEQAIRDLQFIGTLLDLGHIKVIKTGKTGSVINT